MEEINSKLTVPLRIPRRPEVLRRRIKKAMCFITWARKYSPDEAHKKFKGIKDGLRADWPLELTIMDDTIADGWTVLDTKKYLPLGRPTITVNIDVATRMILGHLVSFEHPSLYSALTTLKRANKNKNYIKTLYPEISGSSDACGRCEELLLDNAWQYKAPSLQHSLANLGISVVWAPVRTGNIKLSERGSSGRSARCFSTG
jgi:putative transposase